MARKILLADDSVTAQNMGRKILADAGYDVITVNNGSAALKRITEVKPDLIVLDVYMPGYSGLEVCQRLKDSAETEHIPVLLTVGKLEPFKPEEARRVRADAHIVKPFEASELLTAITKLEDRMVPQHSDGTRFSASVSGVERFGGDGASRKTESSNESDSGWKSRLRFPSKKKKEEPEPEPEDAAAGATFRDFRKGKGKTAASAPFTVKAPPPPGQEPGLVPDIPRDITPEELDALSALAAKLDGPIPAVENIAPLAEQMGPVAASTAELDAPHAQVEETKEVPVSVAEAKIEQKKEDVETQGAEVAPAAASVDNPVFAVEAPAPAPESTSPAEIPVEHIEPVTQPAAETVVTVGDAVAGEMHSQEVQSRETQAPESHTSETPVSVPVNTAALAEEPAPVDQADEPMFAAAANAIAQAAEEKAAEEKIAQEQNEEKLAEALAQSQTAEMSAAEAAVARELEVKAAEPQVEEPKAQEPVTAEAEMPKAEIAEQTVAGAASLPEPEEPSPSDEELAEALRLLTPSTRPDTSTLPSHGTLVAAGQLLAEEAARNASSAGRWVAEPVALSSEEAALSLEAEMFRTLAAVPASMPAISSGGTMEGVGITGVSAIAAAVENRLASMEWASSAKAVEEQENGGEPTAHEPPEHSSQPAPAEPAASGECAEVMSQVSNTATPFVVAAAHEATEPKQIATEKIEANKIEPERKSPPVAEEESAAEETAPATFADAMGKNEVGAPEHISEHVSSAAAAEPLVVAEEHKQDSSPEGEGQESMGKEVKAKSGKSNWHQIRTTPTAAALGSDVVEAAKQAEPTAEEAPKAMAAAAAEGSPAASAPDAGTIASIVDSVMADLRPKIVEEIAKKLAGK